MAAPTPSQTVGPFFSFGLCDRALDEVVPTGSAGALDLHGRVLDGAGEGIPDAMVEVWQADADGTYREGFGWGRSGTAADGGYRLLVAKPGLVPDDAGRLQAPHLTLLVFARGLLKHVHPRVYFPDAAEANAADPTLVVLEPEERDRLVAVAEDGRLRFDVRLQGDEQTPFFAL